MGAGGEGGANGESSMETCTTLDVNQMGDSENSNQGFVTTGGMGVGVRGSFKREGMYVWGFPGA